MGSRQAGRIVGPGLGQVQRPVDEGVAVPGHVGGKDPDLTVGDLAGRARVLPRHAAGGLALLEKAGLVEHQHGVLLGQALDHLVAPHIAERVGLPAPAAKDGLLPPFSPPCGLSLRGIAFGDGPGSPAASARIQPVKAPRGAEQAVQEQACRDRHPLWREQRPDPSLHLAQRTGPQLQRILDRNTRHA